MKPGCEAETRDISVIVTTWSEVRWDSLMAAVESVRTQTSPPGEIVIVVDHNAELAARIRNAVSDALVVDNPSPAPGVAGARNAGVHASRGEILAFLDDDAVALPNWLENLSRAIRGSAILGAGGPVIPSWWHVRPAWFPEELDWVVGCSFRGMPESSGNVERLIGCNMAIHRWVFDELHGFPTEMGRVGTTPVAGDETEFCIQARQRWSDKSWWYQIDACVYHHVPPARTTWKYFRARCYAEGLSKARMVHRVGSRTMLSNERRYVLQTLARAVLDRGHAVMRGDVQSAMQAIAIGVALACSFLGYLHGTLQMRLSPA